MIIAIVGSMVGLTVRGARAVRGVVGKLCCVSCVCAGSACTHDHQTVPAQSVQHEGIPGAI